MRIQSITTYGKALAVVLPVVLAGCSTTGMTLKTASVSSTKKIAQATSPVVNVSGPYDAAKACIARIPRIKELNIGVGKIADNTGKVNVTDGGTGNFISQGTTDFFFNVLYGMGVSVTDLTSDQQADVTFIASAGVKGSMRTPSFIVRGSVTALDFAEQSNVGELSLYGFGPKTRAYNAVGRMDVRLVTLPGGKLPSNIEVATSSVFKQFLAVETETGFGSFIGSGPGLTFASFRFGESMREPMQYTMGFMVDYAAGDMILQLLQKEGDAGQRNAAEQCRALLGAPSPSVTQVAEAK